MTILAPTGAPRATRLTTLVYARVEAKLHRSFEVITPRAVTLVADEFDAAKSWLPR